MPSQETGGKFKYYPFSSPLTIANLRYKLQLLSAAGGSTSAVTTIQGDLSHVW